LMNEKRLAGKQYYRIEHSGSGTVIADDITLYEAALAVVKLLNTNHYVNHSKVRKLFELDDRYTSNRIEAVTARLNARKAARVGDQAKEDIFETKCQSALDKASSVKHEMKQVLTNASGRY